MIIDRITGFEPLTQSGRIEDRNGFFYLFDSKDVKFNLPPGVYEIQGAVRKLKKPIQYGTVKRSIPRHVIKFLPPGNSAFAMKRPGETPVIGWGVDLLRYPTPLQEFIFYHECGHLAGIWDSETGCDTYAAKQMLSRGYNPSQVFWCAEVLKFSPTRVKSVRNYLQKFQKTSR